MDSDLSVLNSQLTAHEISSTNCVWKHDLRVGLEWAAAAGSTLLPLVAAVVSRREGGVEKESSQRLQMMTGLGGSAGAEAPNARAACSRRLLR